MPGESTINNSRRGLLWMCHVGTCECVRNEESRTFRWHFLMGNFLHFYFYDEHHLIWNSDRAPKKFFFFLLRSLFTISLYWYDWINFPLVEIIKLMSLIWFNTLYRYLVLYEWVTYTQIIVIIARSYGWV